MQGSVTAIVTIAEAAGAPTAQDQAELVAGQGIVGDRYFLRVGTFSKQSIEPDQELTLVEAEYIDRFNAETGLAIAYGDIRRNIVTRSISLNDLIDVEFQVGEARVRGIRLCEPCAHLAQLLGHEMLKGLVHKAGLRARILEGGTVRVNDKIAVPISTATATQR